MFTGLVEDVGTVTRLQRAAHEIHITISSRQVSSDLIIGDSVSVNGACLTVVTTTTEQLTAVATAETLRRTNLGQLAVGSRVNLERALRLGDRLGGHLVLGHVDDLGRVEELADEGQAVLMRIIASPELMRLVVPKGSITVDGVSLTVAEMEADGFTISLIPHTLGVTTLQERRVGDYVNLEADIIGKYVARLLALQEDSESVSSSRVSERFLREHGFA